MTFSKRTTDSYFANYVEGTPPSLKPTHSVSYPVLSYFMSRDSVSCRTDCPTKKDNAPIDLTPVLSLDDYVDSNQQMPRSKYFLKAIVYHVGRTPNSGHYTAHALRSDRWLYFDDANTQATTLNDVIASKTNQRNAYMLLYSTI